VLIDKGPDPSGPGGDSAKDDYHAPQPVFPLHEISHVGTHIRDSGFEICEVGAHAGYALLKTGLRACDLDKHADDSLTLLHQEIVAQYVVRETRRPVIHGSAGMHV